MTVITSLGMEDARHSIIDMVSCISQFGLTIIPLHCCFSPGFVVGLCFISLAVSKWLTYFLNYIIDFSPPPFWPENDLEQKELLFAFMHVNRAYLEI